MLDKTAMIGAARYRRRRSGRHTTAAVRVRGAAARSAVTRDVSARQIRGILESSPTPSQTAMAAVSSFVGTPMAVRAPTRTASRQQFCVQNNANAAGPKKGAPAAGAQRFVGYKGSTVAGSAPTTRSGKAGLVYKLGMKNGKGNIDEYAPIYTPEEWKVDGDNYEPGLPGLAAWAATLGAVLLAGGFAIYTTSAL